jgi:hypothetical protein
MAKWRRVKAATAASLGEPQGRLCDTVWGATRTVRAMQVTIFHNPNCPASRKALETIRAHGFEPKIIEYLG